MELPVVNIPGEITFTLQAGLLRDTMTSSIADLTLTALKGMAINFLNKKFPENGMNRLEERVLLFRHDYRSENLLVPVMAITDVLDGCLLEIVLTAENSIGDLQNRPHSLLLHSYKSPTFCDYCGEMLFGLVRQGLKCEGCGLSYHKRCVYKIPNNCTHTRRRRSSSFLQPQPTSDHVSASLSIPNIGAVSPTSPTRTKKSSLPTIRPLERSSSGRMKVPHRFEIHSYTRPTVCYYCKKLLKGIIRQGMQCKDCKLNVHKRKCLDCIPMDCLGEAPKESVGEKGKNSVGDNCHEKEEIDDESEEENDQSEDKLAAAAAELEVADDESKVPVQEASSNNIPLQRIIQSVKHTKCKGYNVIKEGWLVHHTNRDSMRKRHFWRLDCKNITLFQNDTTSKYYKVMIFVLILIVCLCIICSFCHFVSPVGEL